MSNPSLQLTLRDFDAYRAEKATSNAYSRPRMEVKQRALAWGRGVVERLAALGIAVDVHGSDEHPSLRNKKRVDCQWVFFWRGEQAAREELDRILEQGRSISAVIDDPSPYTRHAFLALRIDAESIEVCFAVHPDAKVDVDNLRARLAATAPTEGAQEPRRDEGPTEAPLAAEFTSALRALPEQFMIGVSHDERVECGATTAEAIVAMLERAAGGQTPLWIGWSVPRDTALAHVDLIDEQLQDAIVALSPIYRLVAWSRENDHIALDRRIEGLEQERARTHAEVTAQNERWRAEKTAQRERSQKEAQARVEEAAREAAAAQRAPSTPAKRPSLDTLFKPRSAEAGRPDAHANKPEAHANRPEPRRDGRGPGQAPKKPGGKAATTETGAKHGAERDARSAEARPESRSNHVERSFGGPAQAPQGGASQAGAAKERDSASEARHPSSTSIEKGSWVRVLTGAFAQKIGVVNELDGRGGARVLLGLLSTRLDVSALELAPEQRDPAPPPAVSTAGRAAAPAARRAR